VKEGDWPDTYQAREHACGKKKIVFFREFLSRARTLSRTKYETCAFHSIKVAASTQTQTLYAPSLVYLFSVGQIKIG
jgi:hypothetical protein